QKSRWFQQRTGDDQQRLRVNDELRALISFKQLNLMHEWPVLGPFDAVFCRNVLIYFDPETKKAVIEQFAKFMHRDSRLFLGHSESLFRMTELFIPLGQNVYTRTSPGLSDFSVHP
ncbi:MAG: chemotaxis protein CheR, partial [Gammaproteobacteria bacterium]|nr:chemotaxis protein CheR [Gammaproteobacteria bacterium]